MRKIDLNEMTHFFGDFKRCEHTILGKIVPGKIKIKNLLYCGDTSSKGNGNFSYNAETDRFLRFRKIPSSYLYGKHCPWFILLSA